MYLKPVSTKIMANGETTASEGSYSDMEKRMSHRDASKCWRTTKSLPLSSILDNLLGL